MPDTPEIVEPTQDYLGFLCETCGKHFSIVGPLDLEKRPREQPMQVGASGPLHATCTHCGHSADYSIKQLIRFSQ